MSKQGLVSFLYYVPRPVTNTGLEKVTHDLRDLPCLVLFSVDTITLLGFRLLFSRRSQLKCVRCRVSDAGKDDHLSGIYLSCGNIYIFGIMFPTLADSILKLRHRKNSSDAGRAIRLFSVIKSCSSTSVLYCDIANTFLLYVS